VDNLNVQIIFMVLSGVLMFFSLLKKVYSLAIFSLLAYGGYYVYTHYLN